jgi:hypothetical protein
MNYQPKNKILLLIIVILLVTNMTMLFFFFRETPAAKWERPDRQQIISNYLKNEVRFNDDQLRAYEQLGKKYKEEITILFDSLSKIRKRTFQEIGAEKFSDSAILDAAERLKSRQDRIEIMMLRHLVDIRSLCSPEQKAIFDTGFYKIMSRRSSENKKSRKE